MLISYCRLAASEGGQDTRKSRTVSAPLHSVHVGAPDATQAYALAAAAAQVGAAEGADVAMMESSEHEEGMMESSEDHGAMNESSDEVYEHGDGGSEEGEEEGARVTRADKLVPWQYNKTVSYKVRQCKLCQTRWNRDVNAARNIILVARWRLAGMEGRPGVLARPARRRAGQGGQAQ